MTRKIYHFIVLLFVTAILSTSCSKQKIAEKVKRDIAVEAIENITGSLSGGWVITLRVRNLTAYEPTLNIGEGDLYLDDVLTAHASLMAPVTMPKKAVSSIDIPLEITIHNPIKAISLVLRLSEKNFEGVDIAFNATVEMMGIKKSIGTEKVPATTILNKLGYSVK